MMIGLLLVVLLFVLYRGVVGEGETMGIFHIFLLFAIVLLLFSMRLRTDIDREGVHVDFRPFVWNKTRRWEDIESVEVRKYALWEYGGWGYRIGPGGIAYTIRGFYGFQVKLKNGKKFLVGTQKPETVREILKNLEQDGII